MRWWPYLSLFWIASLAATVFRAQSENLLAALIAGVRPTLGSSSSSQRLAMWIAGQLPVRRFLHRYRDRRWFPIRVERWTRLSKPIGAGAFGRCFCPGRPALGIRSPLSQPSEGAVEALPAVGVGRQGGTLSRRCGVVQLF